GRDHARPVAREKNEIEAVFDLVDAVFDGDAGHRRSLLALELMSWKSGGSYPLPAGNSSFLSWFGRNRLLRNRHTRTPRRVSAPASLIAQVPDQFDSRGAD